MKISVKGNTPNGEMATILLPVDCRVTLVPRRYNSTLRAVATLSYAGFIIKNIQIHEDRGEIDVRYPSVTFKRKDGNEVHSVSVHPTSAPFGAQLNHLILSEYSKLILSNSGFATLSFEENEESEEISVVELSNDSEASEETVVSEVAEDEIVNSVSEETENEDEAKPEKPKRGRKKAE